MRTRKIGERLFVFAETIDDPVQTQFAALEYRLEGFCCRVFREDWGQDLYVSVMERKRKILPATYTSRRYRGGHDGREKEA